MENKTAVKRPHSIMIENRVKAVLSGVDKVVAATEGSIMLETSEGGLVITGDKLKIVKYDAETGALTFEGTVNQIKYSAAKVSLAKKLFK